MSLLFGADQENTAHRVDRKPETPDCIMQFLCDKYNFSDAYNVRDAVSTP